MDEELKPEQSYTTEESASPPITAAASPKKRLRLSAYIILVILLAALGNELLRPHKGSGEIVIPSGSGSRVIAQLLKENGIIRSKWTFVSYATLTGRASNLKPGVYTFTRASIPAIVRDITKGGGNEHTIVIPEGWTGRDIQTHFQERGIGEKDSSPLFSVTPALKDEFLFLSELPTGIPLEGYLFPDTYRVFADAPIEGAVQKMLRNFDNKVTEDLRVEIAAQKKTLFEIITAASLIEREVITDEDRAIVSGIIWKRLEFGIPLQIDATISYIKKLDPSAEQHENGRISLTDTKIDSPYNTYLYPGLPEGPIANPGISAIRAAIYPKDSPYLYYLSTPDGETIFSETLEEHNEAKATHLR